MTTTQAVVPAATTAPPPPRAPVRRRPLATMRDVKREIAGLYWSARRDQIATADASRLCFLLVSLAKVIEGTEIEARIAALEAGAARGVSDDD